MAGQEKVKHFYVKCCECRRRIRRYDKSYQQDAAWSRSYVFATCCPGTTVPPICWRCLVPHLNLHMLGGTEEAKRKSGLFFEADYLAKIIKRSEKYQRAQQERSSVA